LLLYEIHDITRFGGEGEVLSYQAKRFLARKEKKHGKPKALFARSFARNDIRKPAHGLIGTTRAKRTPMS
jgi:hypothetical protein